MKIKNKTKSSFLPLKINKKWHFSNCIFYIKFIMLIKYKINSSLFMGKP